VVASCVKCEPKNVINGSKFSSSNSKSHLKRKHDSSFIDEYENYINDEQKINIPIIRTVKIKRNTLNINLMKM